MALATLLHINIPVYTYEKLKMLSNEGELRDHVTL